MSKLFKAIGPLYRAPAYHLERDNPLASNIAHVDTPDYVPRDIEQVTGGRPLMGIGAVLAVSR